MEFIYTFEFSEAWLYNFLFGPTTSECRWKNY